MSFHIKVIFFAFILLFQLQVDASTLDSLRVEKSKGKKFIVHRVEPKETLYSISKRYDVSLEDLQKFNPSLTDGLKMYQELLIPITKKKEGKTSVTKNENVSQTYHIVQQGETMYSISRKYHLSVDSLMSFNQMKNSNLSLGDTLQLMGNYQTETKKPIEANSKEKTLQEIPASKEKSNGIQTSNATNPSNQYHTVEQGETMFGISKKYQVSLEELTKWNNMDSFELEIGQQLIVSQTVSTANSKSVSEKNNQLTPVEPKIETKEETKKVKKDSILITKKTAENDTIFLKTDNSPFKTKYEVMEGQTYVLEEGFVMQMDNTDHVTKYLGLHKTAPIGTTIQVVNVMNNLSIDVKIVGQLPETALDRNVMMRLSGAAFKKLASPDQKIPVQTKYVKE